MDWDREYPWAAGRQEEIYDLVGEEVVRQKAAGWWYEVDLDDGVIEIVRRSPKHRAASRTKKRVVTAPPPKRSPAWARFLASVVPVWKHWRDDQTYDLTALAMMPAEEREELVELLTGREVTWREVEALAVVDTPEARAAVDAASKHHLSIDTRLAAAEVLHQQGRLPELDVFLARQIRHLDRPQNGLKRVLQLAGLHPSEVVKQALLWASYNQTACAPACAKLLLALAGAAKEPFDGAVEQMLEKLGFHNSYFDRQAAFEGLCQRVGMQLDPNAAE
jgi:hypothetical protein